MHGMACANIEWYTQKRAHTRRARLRFNPTAEQRTEKTRARAHALLLLQLLHIFQS